MGNTLDYMSSPLKLLFPLGTQHGGCPQSSTSGGTCVPGLGVYQRQKEPQVEQTPGHLH